MIAAFLVVASMPSDYLVSVVLCRGHLWLRFGWGPRTRWGIWVISILVWYGSNRKPLLTSFSHLLASCCLLVWKNHENLGDLWLKLHML